MDFGDNGNIFCLNGNTTANANGNNNSNNNNGSNGWYSWEAPSGHVMSAFQTAAEGSGESGSRQQPPLYGSHVHPDPHLTCLKLGKRHYFEDAGNSNVGGELFGLEGDKRARGGGGGGGEKAGTVARCQVEGCQVALVDAKEYHRRHKVCETHSKAAKVVVLGREQRFCQQCSRFHAVSEFDDSKRSCRRRLAGHNERRRKSSHHSVARNPTIQGCALSLLSPGSGSWLSHADLSIRCSAALHELIAENRASLITRQQQQQQQQQQQLVLDRDHHWHLHHHAAEEQDSKEMHDIPESNYFPQHIFPHTQ